ncbi:exodeoxyribonuclease X C-terminal domain-containing protein [Flavivirga rizhaonensis]|uniref:Exodeoxyribonuclease X-like C-terminal domain-containing protein n=1 Tax=Flavivirga rizhaonensis TaxID=2559571 RepID=A0A4S1DYS3_9FLAO|nr:hypothetical protein [Flavivirga rizhaonensis]TGV03350.1 hypothetical protein EM932_06660 [Flavivirga rizhaonensis]
MKVLAIFLLNVFQNIIGMTFGWLFRPKTKRNSYLGLSDIDKVKYLEKRRQYKGYKKQWLYYRCREEGLLDAYRKLFKNELDQQDSGTKFSFGKYKGQFVEDVWESDREYINWLSRQEWLAEYLDENDMIHELLHLEEENQN